MMLVLQIAVGVILAKVIFVIASSASKDVRQLFEDEQAYQAVKRLLKSLVVYLLVVFLGVGYIVLASESLLPSFLQGLWDG